MLVHAGCWHRPRTDGFVFFKHEDTGGGPGLVEKGAVASWAALFRPGLGWAAARAFPGALKRGLGRGPDGPRLVLKDVPAQRRSQRRVGRRWTTALTPYRPNAFVAPGSALEIPPRSFGSALRLGRNNRL